MIQARNSKGQFLTGDADMLKALRRIAAKVPSVAAAALYMEGERVMRRSKNEFVPVGPPMMGGALKRSGMVDPPARGLDPEQSGAGPRDWVVKLSYGGEAMDYALAVHEHFSEHTPRSWRVAMAHGKTIQFRLKGTGPKYLEKPLMDAQRGLDERIAEKVRMVWEGAK